ncbi:uncharacterized protein PHACADRAFT_208283 [Phanerochaete carnosa HHB-10118-sp]|uniref:Uncharacterized protein n=1 Tax=Phanerochaete carnosa (strain HHB-10118-sp) TaxID=650164 RepID=K5WDM7_PHACS|nr:uncharacterized protein PHACADRAFT_208283 [Phanerochaete carnosa HHB-10118-sp]EKM57139.1 hypothetical protein PHACADRAFT_208283 [Phanerochaete carnosa HHB-10118-sp]
MSATFMTQYPRWYKRPFKNPYKTLCHAYNVDSPLSRLAVDAEIPRVIDMRVLQTHDIPTHALIVLDASRNGQEPLVLPIDLAAFNATFQNGNNLRVPSQNPLPPTNHRYGVPYRDPDGWTVTLPTLVIEAPHPRSLPLLLLYSLWDHLPNKPPAELTPPPSPEPFRSAATTLPVNPRTPPSSPTTTISLNSQSSIASDRAPTPPPPPPERPLVCTAQLATYLLPTAVLEEFPAYPAQAAALARACTDDELRAHRAFNGGLWRNVLLLAPRAHAIQDIASNAWNTAAAAYKYRAEYRADRTHVRRRGEKDAAQTGRGQEGVTAVPLAAKDTQHADQRGEASSISRTTSSESGGREVLQASVQESHSGRNA